MVAAVGYGSYMSLLIVTVGQAPANKYRRPFPPLSFQPNGS